MAIISGCGECGGVGWRLTSRGHDHELIVAVRDGWGYLHMWTDDDDGIWVLEGDPASPAYVQGESEFAAGTGLPVAEVAAALREFMTTTRRPECVRWVPDRP